MNSLTHYVSGKALADHNGQLIVEEGDSLVLFGMGCFWGAERKFWVHPSVKLTAAGYAGGHTESPSYEAVCSGTTGHAEVVAVTFRPEPGTFRELLAIFWENHDPTQGMRQGNDIGTQYRSTIYCISDQDYKAALCSKDIVERLLQQQGYPKVTTEILRKQTFYLAEEYHQQYLAKNPGGYCGLGGTGIAVKHKLLDELLDN